MKTENQSEANQQNENEQQTADGSHFPRPNFVPPPNSRDYRYFPVAIKPLNRKQSLW